MTRLYERISTQRLTERLDARLREVGLPPWVDDGFGPDAMWSYCKRAGRPDIGFGPPDIKVDEAIVREEWERARAQRPTLPTWDEVGRPLVEHAMNKIVVAAVISTFGGDSGCSFHLWDGEVEEKSEPSLAVTSFAREDWGSLCFANEPWWWLSFDSDKILFTPDFALSITIFHHDCFHVAGLQRDPVEAWSLLGIRMKAHPVGA